MKILSVRIDQLVDWRAVAIAGTLGAVFFLLLNMLLKSVYLGSPELTWRILASILLGPEAILPDQSPPLALIVAALAVHIPLSLLFTALIAVVVHEWGLLPSVLVGGLLGIALYLINFYGLSLAIPWLRDMASWMMLATHLAFGGLVAGVYEVVERDIYLIETSLANP